MLLLGFLVTLLSQIYGVASGVPAGESTSQPDDSLKRRTHFDIIWSCVATLFICTWVAIHPNVPPRGEGPIRSFWRRIKLMLWTLVVPELILLWAYRQWAAAKYLGQLFQDDGWTATHGHFVIMGGFAFVDKMGVESVLDYESFLELWSIETYQSRRHPPRFPESCKIAFPTITAEEIHDKARGDFLSKALVILQSLWFIGQCIARGKQDLALTELELVTLALASLNGIMYYFWWDKPLGVNEPIKIYPIGGEPPPKIIDGVERLRRFHTTPQPSLPQRLLKYLMCSASSIFHNLRTTFFRRTQPFGFHHKLASVSLSTINKFLKKEREELEGDLPCINYLWFIYLPCYWLFQGGNALIEPISVIANTHYIKPGATHVPTFYAPRSDNPSTNDFGVIVFLPIIAIAFGGLHCIGWNFHFPTPVEQLLWRIGSLAITFIPLAPVVLFLFGFFMTRFYFHIQDRYIGSIHISSNVMNFLKFLQIMLWFPLIFIIAVLGIIGYLLARLLLLTQAIILLRRQPDSAFYAIKWVNFLPHL